MTPPLYTALRRRSLRRPAIILAVVFTVAFMACFMRDIVFDAQHSTRIAFKFAGGRSEETVTLTEWATPTLRLLEMPMPKPKAKDTRLKAARVASRTAHLPRRRPPRSQPPRRVSHLRARRARQAAWAAKLAAASTSLRAAAAKYTHRYARPPPRGFDKRWAYAAAHAVPLPDGYDQIDRDLAHFYGAAPVDLRAIQRDWEAHADSYTIGKDAMYDGISMLNFTLPEDAEVLLELAAGASQIVDLLKEVERDIPPFRAVFSPHDNPNLVADYELKKRALDAAAAGNYIDVTDPTPQKHSWPAACPPLSPAQLDALPPSFDAARPNTAPPSVPGSGAPKTFIHAHLPPMDPCLHPGHLTAHGHYSADAYYYSYSSYKLRVFVPAARLRTRARDAVYAKPRSRSVPDDLPNEGRAPPLGGAGATRRCGTRRTGAGVRRTAALGAGRGTANVSVLVVPGSSNDVRDENPNDGAARGEKHGASEERHGDERTRPVGAPREVPRARWVHALLDVAFAGAPLNADAGQSALLAAFEFRAPHDLRTAGRYKQVGGNGWSSRFKRLMNSGLLIFKATAYPEWFTDRIAPWVHYIPIQNSYADLLDALLFFRGDPAGGGTHNDMARRIAGVRRGWSRRLFLEYARVMSADRAGMSLVMWPDVGDAEVRERVLMERWRKPQAETEEEEDGWVRS
ncbi:hypothetical protein B0H17DRAFT_1191784 [Mycena rosella]|uniref:Glycosyl transferase CAP10 domain-containing protein n=1 Tax=Mycena rosella TaxID=1033263 RepID=A0AAD7GZ37_MYCRO|nr:hypothetical protein B0H17DRAFT_1191784 [Mycena rosella]